MTVIHKRIYFHRTLCGRGGFNSPQYHGVEYTRNADEVTCKNCIKKMLIKSGK